MKQTVRTVDLRLYFNFSLAHYYFTEEVQIKRRGRKGYFQGSREEYLESHLPAYRALGKGRRGNFWTELFNGWWERYPWKLSDKEEPPTNDEEEMARLSEVGPGEIGLQNAVVKALTDVGQSFSLCIGRRVIDFISARKELVQ